MPPPPPKHYMGHRRLQSEQLLPSLDDLLPKKHHESGPSKQMPTDALSQIAIFTLDTVKITKRFACANKQRAQQTGALLTELTRRRSNLGSGSHGRLFRPYWGSSAWHSRRPMNGENPSIKEPLMSPPPLRFERLRRLCCLRHMTENSFFMGSNRSHSISLSTI